MTRIDTGHEGALARPPGTPLRVFAATIALGVAWLGLELCLLLVGDRSLTADEMARRAAGFLPWQLLLFASLGLGVAGATWIFRLRMRPALWLALGSASFLFVGARVGEGMLRRNDAATAFVVVLLLALALSSLFLLLRLPERFLPSRIGRAYTGAIWVLWSLSFLPFLRRAGPALGLGKTGPLGWLAFVSPGDIAIAFAAGLLVFGAVLLAGARSRVAVSSLAIALGAVIALSSVGPRAEERPSSQPDVLVILIDTWRFDHLGFHRDGDSTASRTPALDVLARESVVFDRAYAPSNLTRRSMPGILSSYPWHVTGAIPLSEDAYTMAELLRDAGYGTYGISTNPNVAAQFGYDQGFDVFVDPSLTNDFLIAHMLQVAGTLLPGPTYQAGLVTAALYYRPASEVRRRGLRLLRDGKSPSFLYLHTMDPHGPYLPPKQHLPEQFRIGDFYSYYDFERLQHKGVLNSDRFRPNLTNLLQRYEGEVRFTDEELGALMDELRAAGRWDETLVWITSDHGEAFGEHDFAGHGGPNLTSTLIHVPLLVKLPSSWNVPPRVVEEPVSNYDLLPTTAGLLGLPVPDGLFGEDLSDAIRHGRTDPGRSVVAYAESRGTRLFSAVRGPWKLVVSIPPDAPEERELFHLETDPDESTDVLAAHPQIAGALEGEIEAWRERRGDGKSGSQPEGRLDPAMEEKLRALGYIDDSE